MDETALYNWGPTAQLMLMGLLVAGGPLVWVWWKSRGASVSRRMQLLTVLTLFLTFDLVLFGAFTRLTDSGLGCPDWPGCYGHASPLGASGQIDQAVSVLPSGPVTHGKAWVEMIHRYLATGVGVLILVMTALAWVKRSQLAASPWWPTLTLFWVCLQGAFGALTVTMKLFPAVVTLHLLGGLVLLALLRKQSVHFARSGLPQGAGRVTHSRGLFALWCAVTALVWLQIALGGWVSTNYAVLACTEFPACQGSWWPDMNFSDGFSLWRALGEDARGQPLAFSALTAIHYVHRMGAYVVIAGVSLLAWRLHRVPALRGGAKWLALLVLWQFATGLSNVVFDWPLLAAVSHTGGAAGLVVVLTGIWSGVKDTPHTKHAVAPVSSHRFQA
jgi:cytochrome c oxidase assembly protein subunit 15